MKDAWRYHAIQKYYDLVTREDNHRSLPVESCLVQSRGVFIQKIRFLLWKPIQEADAAWPDLQDHSQLGEAHLAQVESLSKPDEKMEG